LLVKHRVCVSAAVFPSTITSLLFFACVGARFGIHKFLQHKARCADLVLQWTWCLCFSRRCVCTAARATTPGPATNSHRTFGRGGSDGSRSALLAQCFLAASTKANNARLSRKILVCWLCSRRRQGTQNSIFLTSVVFWPCYPRPPQTRTWPINRCGIPPRRMSEFQLAYLRWMPTQTSETDV
jgi:hypothetical protein